MKKIRVADINVKIKYKYPTLTKQAQPYFHEFDEDNVTIEMPDEDIDALLLENPHLTRNDIEYVFTGAAFYDALLHFNGFLLHSSCVCVDGYAYLFSADPGTGKSTHTALWQKYLGEDKAQIINDDKPAVRIKDGKIYAYGTPWSGKTDKNLNMRIPVGAIVFIERSTENWIRPISVQDAIPRIMEQTIRPKDTEKMVKLLDILDKVLSEVPVYKLGCDMSKEAVELSYNTIRKDR